MKLLRFLLIACTTVVTLTACGVFFRPDPGIGKPVGWSELGGWDKDRISQVWQALQAQCPRMSSGDEQWATICEELAVNATPSDAAAREFLQRHFVPHRVNSKTGKPEGLITGYYEPILNGSLTKTETYQYPVYSRPEEMFTVELAGLYPDLKGMRLRGRIDGNKLVPFHSREVIDGEQQPLQGQELLWIDDPYGSFFLQIQGSGKVRLADNTVVGLDYADQNGHPYFAIGKKLVEIGAIDLADVSLFTIREWLDNNPERADEILNTNPSYVFFNLREDVDEGPRGSLNVPLTAERSVAVDRTVIPLGTPVWLDTTLPDGSEYQRLMVAQDTGGAIRGAVRADVFFGTGEGARRLAGEMKQKGRLFALLPLEK